MYMYHIKVLVFTLKSLEHKYFVWKVVSVRHLQSYVSGHNSGYAENVDNPKSSVYFDVNENEENYYKD